MCFFHNSVEFLSADPCENDNPCPDQAYCEGQDDGSAVCTCWEGWLGANCSKGKSTPQSENTVCVYQITYKLSSFISEDSCRN